MKGLKFLSSVLVLVVGVFCSYMVSADEYSIDKTHSTIGFSAKHLMVSKTTGMFKDYDGVIKFDPNDLAASKIDITVQAASIDTRHDQRDGHLKSPDFLDTEKFPKLNFTTISIIKEGEVYKLTGDLTIKDVTIRITIPAEISGPVNSPMGGTAIGIQTNFKINRQDFNVTFSKTMDNGGLVVSDEINIDVTIEAYKK